MTLAACCQEQGARILAQPDFALNVRDLLASGCPLTVDDSDRIAAQLVSVQYRRAERKKVLALDLDGTLWHGVIGEDGVAAITAGPEGAGFPHHIFQQLLLRLKDEGVLLAFCSKNNEADVIPFLDSLDMPLRLSDFAARRCNWNRKSQGLVEMATELNLGLDSIVYVDDNPAEIAEIQSHLPMVTCLTAPRTAAAWPLLWKELRNQFWTWQVSEEDRLRTDRLRTRAEQDIGGLATVPSNGTHYLKSLGLELEVNVVAFDDPRSLELINKTNQFNLSGERLDQSQWLTVRSDNGAVCISARLRDRYGDFGTIAVLCGRVVGELLEIRQMVLSCRAFGRCVEHGLLQTAISLTRVSELAGRFRDTGRNAPAGAFLAEMGIASPAPVWNVSVQRVLPTIEQCVRSAGLQVKVAERTATPTS